MSQSALSKRFEASSAAKVRFLPHFSHIYIERSVAEEPFVQRIVERFPRAQIVQISNYKEIFNRPKQAWRLQKQSQKLILAKRNGHFLYKCGDAIPSFGERHHYYNSLMLNCIYDCDYCFLQGLFPSANMVVFTNVDDYVAAVDQKLKEHPLALSISYETDLLAFEGVVPYCREWIEITRSRPTLLTEIRTKSANFAAIADIEPVANVILSWTVSPDLLIGQYEPRTAPLLARLEAARAAAERGWPVRLCLDPILRVDNWQQLYRQLVETIFSKINSNQIRDVAVGAFRMNRTQLKQIQDSRHDSDILFYPFHSRGSFFGYSAEHEREMVEAVALELGRFLNSDKICSLTAIA